MGASKVMMKLGGDIHSWKLGAIETAVMQQLWRGTSTVVGLDAPRLASFRCSVLAWNLTMRRIAWHGAENSCGVTPMVMIFEMIKSQGEFLWSPV